ncbi:MAG: hypothetical protein IKC51_01495 [Myxococcaceae bacterium]|nr:hypothetical protein [Myxococcaceae bacterium]
MEFQLEHPVSQDRLEAAAERIFGVGISEIRVRADSNIPKTPEEEAKKFGIAQNIRLKGRFFTRVTATDTPDPRAAAHALAVEGGVEVLWFDDRDDSEDLEEDFYGYTIGPYLLFKPDGSEHKARLQPVKDVRALHKEICPILLD